MSALMVPVKPLSQRERMAQILSAAAYGLARVGMCEDCTETRGLCSGCEQANADVAAFNAAIGAVEDAPTEAAALAAYFDCLARAASLAVVIETASVPCGTGDGR
jgi:hypothetical protein